MIKLRGTENSTPALKGIFMNNISRKKLIAFFVLVYVLFIGLLILFAGSLTRKDPAANTGLFKSESQINADAQPDRQTEQERLEEYESREEMPSVTEENFYTSVVQFLSVGNFTELDILLRYWQETYKDSQDESESKTAVIERYRGDLSYYAGIKNSQEALENWQFKTADTLASCIAYTPIMQKYNAFIDQDSVLFPAMQEGASILLSKSEKTNEELAEIKREVNRTRTDENAFQQIEVYDLTLHDYPCQLIAVMDRDSMAWMPYSLKVMNDMIDLPTVSLGKQLLQSNPNCDLDVSIAIPAMVSERPEGMNGNIDYSQKEILSGDGTNPISDEPASSKDPVQAEPAEADPAGEGTENVPGAEDPVQP